MFTNYASQIDVFVYDRNGDPVIHIVGDDEIPTCEHKIVLYNSPIKHLLGDTCFIDWTPQDDIMEQATIEDIIKEVAGYFGTWAWGPSVKDGRTLGLKVDPTTIYAMFKHGEDAQRIQQWAASNFAGGCAFGNVKVKIVPNNALYNNTPMADGWFFISQSLYDVIIQSRVYEPIRADRPSKDSYSIAQWVMPECVEEWPELIDRAQTMLQYGINRDPNTELGCRGRLFELNQDMIKHSWMLSPILRADAESSFRILTSFPMRGRSYMLVPTRFETPVVDLEGKTAIWFHPADNRVSLQAWDIEPTPEYKEELAHINSWKLVQIRMSGENAYLKGFGAVLPDSEMQGYDVITSNENIKLYNGDLEELRKAPEMVFDGYIGVTMEYAEGQALGIHPDLAKRSGKDFDGDPGNAASLKNKPKTWSSIKKHSHGTNFKLPKSKSPMDARPELIMKSMMNIVGFATMVNAGSLMSTDRLSLAINLMPELRKDLMKYDLPFNDKKPIQNLETLMSFFIKAGTDIFKTSLDAVMLLSDLKKYQKIIPYPTYVNWKEQLQYSLPILITGDEESLPHYTKEELENAITPEHGGTVVEIIKVVYPIVKEEYSKELLSAPLSTFLDWSLPVDEEMLQKAASFKRWYDSLRDKTNITDPKSMRIFNQIVFKQAAKRTMEYGSTFVHAVWTVAHSAHNRDNRATVAFTAFIDNTNNYIDPELEFIVEKMPGKKNKTSYTITGVDFQAPGLDTWEGEVEIVPSGVDKVDAPTARIVKRERYVVKVNPQEVPGYKAPQPKYPERMIGLISQYDQAPIAGSYKARITRLSDRSHSLTIL